MCTYLCPVLKPGFEILSSRYQTCNCLLNLERGLPEHRCLTTTFFIQKKIYPVTIPILSLQYHLTEDANIASYLTIIVNMSFKCSTSGA